MKKSIVFLLMLTLIFGMAACRAPQNADNDGDSFPSSSTETTNQADINGNTTSDDGDVSGQTPDTTSGENDTPDGETENTGEGTTDSTPGGATEQQPPSDDKNDTDHADSTAGGENEMPFVPAK